jgi:glucosamine--fructose-6-phosphate aminotransferase (isomerizing)
MCGIVGYIGPKQAQPILLESLKHLEYRGYDSAGIAVISTEVKSKLNINTKIKPKTKSRSSAKIKSGSYTNGLNIHKDKGAISNLDTYLNSHRLSGTVGISHTRWATHGPPSKMNAHPHIDCKGKIALVHNGIIENYRQLKKKLIKKGHEIVSETDTEILAHLIEDNYTNDLESAVRTSLKLVDGSYGIAVIHSDEPDKIVVARNESPLIIGVGSKENFIASDIPAVLKYTKRIIYLHNKELSVISADTIKITDLAGKTIQRDWQEVSWNLEDAEKGGFEHYMIKEIFEEPKAIREVLRGRVGEIIFPELSIFPEALRNGIKIIACGTSYHASLTGKYIFERLTRLPTTVELASEYRYSAPTTETPLVILITQSGETADTLAAAREAQRRGCRTIAITNVVGSSVTREVDDVIYIRVGPEISVAATKSFVGQLICLYLTAIFLAETLGYIKPGPANELKESLRSLPSLIGRVVDDSNVVENCAKRLARAEHIFYIGRNLNYPSALEGALKLKEISYIHAEGYPAGELKHGPLALLTNETPIVAITSKDHTYEKIVSNMIEASARNAPVIAVTSESDQEIQNVADEVLSYPDVPSLLSPVPIAVLLQLLAYYVAKERDCPIDQPRNLAKSVTVE